MTSRNQEDRTLLDCADRGITSFLKEQYNSGRIAGNYFEVAVAKTVPNLRKWLLAAELDRISPNLRDGLRDAICNQRWEALVNAFSRDVAFGTGGIREKMGANRDEVLRLKEEGIHAPIIKGPNTINDVIYLLTSAGVAKYGLQRQPAFRKVVIGFDSRIRGQDFAGLIAGLFLAFEYTVYLFDEACMYPSVTFAVPALKADLGVFISASHNDFRYNGFKLSCCNGSQFDPSERNEIYNKFIARVQFADIKTVPLIEAAPERLWFLGGSPNHDGREVPSGEHKGLPLADPLPGLAHVYHGREGRIIDLHTMHTEHVKPFLLQREMIGSTDRPLSIGFSAFNGSGREAVPRLLGETGFRNVHRIKKLDSLDGMFPAFCSDPGREQQPDPGDWRAADIAVEAFKQECPGEWRNVDLIIGTDPDADRCGVIVKVPEHQRPAYAHPGTGELRDYALLSADEVWSLMLWYRLNHDVEQFGCVRHAETKFIALSHTTTDALAQIARKFGIGVLRTWVGFAQLAAGTRAIWDLHRGRDTSGITEGGRLPSYQEGHRSGQDAVCNRTMHSWDGMDDPRRCVNVAALEQSNGFSILGGPPPDERSLGVGGHVRDKDGAFATVLVAEVAQYAKEEGVHFLDLLDEKVYADPDIGLYLTHYEPDPLDGEYEGLAGYTKKREILARVEQLTHGLQSGGLRLGDFVVNGAVAYRTGKYDRLNWSGFPDEGIRFYFDVERRSHLTIRPSGTSNALRFHVQLFGGHPTQSALIKRKAELRAAARRIVGDLRLRIGATT